MTFDDRVREFKKKRFPKMYDDFLNDHEMSIRTSYCLENLGIHTIQALVLYSEKELLSGRNMGRKSLLEIKELLHTLHLSLHA